MTIHVNTKYLKLYLKSKVNTITSNNFKLHHLILHVYITLNKLVKNTDKSKWLDVNTTNALING